MDETCKGSVASSAESAAALVELRKAVLSARVGPLARYMMVDYFTSGLLSFALTIFIQEIVCGGNPGTIAIFTFAQLCAYNIPHSLLAPLHGELADRIPRKPVIIASSLVDFACLFMTVTHPNLVYVLAWYVVRAVLNMHELATALMLLDLTLFDDDKLSVLDASKVRRLGLGAVSARADEVLAEAGDHLLSRALVVAGGLHELQKGGLRVGAYAGCGSVVGTVVGTVAFAGTVRASSPSADRVRNFIYAVLALRALSQLFLLPVPETRPVLRDGSVRAVVRASWREARRTVAFGWRDELFRLRNDEPVLNALFAYMWFLAAGITVWLIPYTSIMFYRWDPSVRERASLMVLIVPIALGLIMYVFHVRRSPLEVMRMPYFVVVAAVGMAIGCAATEMVGFVLASAVLLVGIINAGLPAWAMWTAQAPVDKQARLNSVMTNVAIFTIILPCGSASFVAYMLLTGRWSTLHRYAKGTPGAKRDHRPTAPATAAPDL